MNIAITGHTKGIGKYLYENLNKNNNVLGFSFSTGFDIGNYSDRSRIIEQSKHCDIFINNAFNYKKWDNSQLDLLNMIFDEWKTFPEKHIINFSSAASELYPFKETIPGIPKYHEYVKAKWEQDQWFLKKRDMISNNTRVKLTNIKPGKVLVEKFEKMWKKENVLSCDEILKIIKFILENKDLEFNNITVKKFVYV